MNLVRLIYASEMTQPMSMPALVGLLEKARPNNARLGLTGMLTFGNGQFLQALEGSPVAVNRLYARLLRDPRHVNAMLLAYGPVNSRAFGRWAMGFHRWGEGVGSGPEDFHPMDMDPPAALELLLELSARIPAGQGGPAA